MKRNSYCTMLVFLAILFLSGCSDLTKAKPAAESALTDFHTKFNSKKFRSIYDEAHENLKNHDTFANFSEFMGAVHKKLGHVVSSENQSWNVQNFNLTVSVVLQQNTKFERGEATEVFTYIFEDEKATLAGYNINSRALIVN